MQNLMQKLVHEFLFSLDDMYGTSEANLIERISKIEHIYNLRITHVKIYLYAYSVLGEKISSENGKRLILK